MEELIQEISELFDSILMSFSNEQTQIQEFLKIHSLFKDSDLKVLFESGNHYAGGCVLNQVLKYLKKLKKVVTNPNQKLNKDLKKKIFINIEKLKFLMGHIKASFQLANDDLICLSNDHERKIALKKITTTVYVKNKEEVEQLAESMNNKSNIIKAVIYKTQKYNKSVSRNLMAGWLVIYYSIFASKKIKILAKVLRAEMDSEKLALFWKLIDSKLLSKIISKEFSPIKVNTLIFIPRLSNSVLDLTISEITNNNQKESISPEINFTYAQNSESSRIPVRILSSIPINKLNKGNKGLNNFSLNNEDHQFEKIIIHVHGGGFIAMSTYYYQVHTRIWANELNIPIFSIDYRLAPEHKFPAGLDDVWQVYTWIVENAHKYIGIQPKQIILVGDSAGGNLIIGITLKAISIGYRVPDSVCLMFPCANLDENYFSTGILISLEDRILPYKNFQAIKDNYIPDNFSVQNYFLSPIFAPQEYIAKFPKTEMLITLKDPLAQDTTRFAERLLQANVDIHISEYPELSHGALSYKQFPYDVIEALKKLFI